MGNGRADSEIVVAALRLRGMQQSWDENRFLRHLAYVMDWARKSDLPEDAWTRTLLRRASSRGTLRRNRAAHPGDVALFALVGSPGSPSRVLAAVVVSVTGQALGMVGPLAGGIRDLRMGIQKNSREDTALRSCPAPVKALEVARGGPPGHAGRRRDGTKRRAARAPPPEPCRTGDLYLGRIPWQALPGLFR